MKLVEGSARFVVEFRALAQLRATASRSPVADVNFDGIFR